MEPNNSCKPRVIQYYKSFRIEDYRGVENAIADFMVERFPRGSARDRGMTYRLWFKLIHETRNLCLYRCEKISCYNSAKDYGEVIIPSEIAGFPVTEIGDSAFNDDFAKTEFEFNKRYSQLHPTWSPYNSFEKLFLPDSISRIGEWAFKGCSILKKVAIPETLSYIGSGAFYGSGLTEIIIPKTVYYIGESAFSSCQELLSLSVDKDNEYYDSRNKCNAIIHTASNRIIAVCQNTILPDSSFVIDSAISLNESKKGAKSLQHCIIPDYEKTIGSSAFADFTNLRDILIPNSITQIGNYAFQNCQKLNHVIIPNSVNKIGAHLFSGCDELTFISIPQSVSYIGHGVFDHCHRLSSITVNGQNAIYDSRDDCNAIIETATNTLVQGCAFTIIPNTINKIGKCAFSGCTRLTSIVLPDSVTEIDDNAFEDCKHLKTIIIPNSVKRIGSHAFYNCNSLDSIIIPDSVDEIGYNAFENCTHLRQIHVKNASLFFGKNVPEDKIVIVDSSLIEAQNDKEPRDNSKRKTKGNQQMQIRQDSLYFESSTVHKDYPFDDIINKTMEIIKQHPEKSFNEAFYDSMEYFIDFFLDAQHVKFMNIYNAADEKQFEHVGFYADFVHSISGIKKLENKKELFTPNRANVDLGRNNKLYGGPNVLTIEQLFRDSNCFGTIFEYCYSYTKPLLADECGFFAIRKSETYEYLYNYRLGELIYEKSHKRCEENKKKFKNWLENVDVCYDLEEEEITNFFFFISNSDKTETDHELDKYCICANIGIVNWKTDPLVKASIVSFLRAFQSFIEQLSFCLYVIIKNHQLRQVAVVASIAQVMARNMSHNIGSHVFSHLISNDAYSKLTDRNIFKAKTYVSPTDVEREYPREQFQDPNNYQLSYFNQYLKSRMDYLSEVTFGIPNMLATRYIFGDVFKELDRVRILLNYISGIPGFKYTFCLKYNGIDLSDENDIAVAFPSDVLGAQAFYNIIENIIRNTAKHACNDDHNVVTFTIEFSDMEGYPEYYCVEIDNGIAEVAIDDLVKKQNERVNTSVLDKENNLRSHSLGLLEMKASGAFLRQVDISKVDSYEYLFDDKDEFTNKHGNLIFLKAINKKGALGYRFFVKKPQELLFVGNWNVDEKERKKWGNVGVGFIGEDGFVNNMEQGKSFSHSFLIYNEGPTEKSSAFLSDENDSKTLLPLRKVRLTQQESEEVRRVIKESCGGLQTLKDCVWKLYMGKMGVEDDDIYIGEVVSRRPDNRQRRQVVFENHSSMEQHEPNWAKKTNLPELWIDNLSSQTQSKLPLFGQFSQADGQMLESLLTRYIRRINHQTRLEIFDAYHNKIIAMDERIQRFANENYEGSSNKGAKIPVSALYESTNVVVPSIKLDPEWFDEQTIHDLERFIDAEIGDAFLLVHYGILERMYKTESLITQHLEAWARKANRVVVTSGRGSHSLNLPKSVCFANLSSVLNAFTECRSKYLINCLINQSRRKNE